MRKSSRNLSLSEVNLKIKRIQKEIKRVEKEQVKKTGFIPKSHIGWYKIIRGEDIKDANRIYDILDNELRKLQNIAVSKSGIDDELDEIEEEEFNKSLSVLDSQATNNGEEFSSSESEGGEQLAEEMNEVFGDKEPEQAYEETRQATKEADGLLAFVDDNLDKLNEEVLNEVFKKTKKFYGDDEQSAKNLGKQYKSVSGKKGKSKVLRGHLENQVLNGVEKLDKMKELIEKKDDNEQWKLWNKAKSKVIGRPTDESANRGSDIIVYGV